MAALAGGMWGAAVGAVPAFIFTGLLAICGAVAAMSGNDQMVQLAFGPFFGPHVSFGGGVAAAAFAGLRGLLPTGRDIGSALAGLKRVDVLLVGGVFGLAGHVLNLGLSRAGVGNWTDTIALTVVLTAVAARLIFGRTSIVGTIRGPHSRRFRPDETSHWLPWQERFSDVVAIGVAVGAAGAYLAFGSGLGPEAAPLAFGISTTVLVFLVMGRHVPVSHHIALPAALGVLHGTGMVGGIACGVAGAVLAEVASRLFLIHGDTHIDPPAVGIAAVVLALKTATFMGWLAGPV
jgi:hypothetical protein